MWLDFAAKITRVIQSSELPITHTIAFNRHDDFHTVSVDVAHSTLKGKPCLDIGVYCMYRHEFEIKVHHGKKFLGTLRHTEVNIRNKIKAPDSWDPKGEEFTFTLYDCLYGEAAELLKAQRMAKRSELLAEKAELLKRISELKAKKLKLAALKGKARNRLLPNSLGNAQRPVERIIRYVPTSRCRDFREVVAETAEQNRKRKAVEELISIQKKAKEDSVANKSGNGSNQSDPVSPAAKLPVLTGPQGTPKPEPAGPSFSQYRERNEEI